MTSEASYDARVDYVIGDHIVLEIFVFSVMAISIIGVGVLIRPSFPISSPAIMLHHGHWSLLLHEWWLTLDFPLYSFNLLDET
jgi:hypothetical protein